MHHISIQCVHYEAFIGSLSLDATNSWFRMGTTYETAPSRYLVFEYHRGCTIFHHMPHTLLIQTSLQISALLMGYDPSISKWCQIRSQVVRQHKQIIAVHHRGMSSTPRRLRSRGGYYARPMKVFSTHYEHQTSKDTDRQQRWIHFVAAKSTVLNHEQSNQKLFQNFQRSITQCQ